MTIRWIIGLASGSSADGVDAALVEIDGIGLELECHAADLVRLPFPRDLREMLIRLGSTTSGEAKPIGTLHRLLGETFAAAAQQVADHAHIDLQQIQAIGCPGHTLWHDADVRFATTLSLGMPAIVAEQTGVTTISDFRARDIAVGGQGTPIGALADLVLLHAPGEERILIHLGGIARLVFLPASGTIAHILGFAIGPCGLLLDGLMRQFTGGRQTFDAGGRYAVQGRCMDDLLSRWLNHPYLQRRPPKSVPRPGFVDEFLGIALQVARAQPEQLHDVLCTATHFVARSIHDAVKRYLPPSGGPRRVLLSGGGVRNGLLLRLVENSLHGATVEKTDVYGIPCEARAALSHAVLAALTLDGVPNNAPPATGAKGSRILGSLTPGSSINWACCLNWMANQTAPLAGADEDRYSLVTR